MNSVENRAEILDKKVQNLENGGVYRNEQNCRSSFFVFEIFFYGIHSLRPPFNDSIIYKGEF